MAGRPGTPVRAGAAAAVAALAALVVHGRSVTFGFTGLDDRDLVVDDAPFLQAPWSLLRAFTRAYMHVVDPSHGYYRPIVTASFALDARFSGVHPAGYHATNVLVHAAASALLYALLRELAIAPWPALGGAVAFAVHPALASAVAWIPGRNDSVLTLFVLAAWLAFARDLASPSVRWKLAHFAAFVLALLTKETAVVVPLVCLAHAISSEGRAPRRSLVYVAGWTAALAGFAALHAGLHAPPFQAPWQAVLVLVASAGKVLLPFAPTAFVSVKDLSAVPGVVAIGVLFEAARRVPGVRKGVVGLGALVFVVGLAPALALGGTTALDCRLELPACGAVLAVVEVAQAAWRSRAGSDGALATAIAVTGLAALAVVTVAFEGSFRDPRSFAKQAVDDAPHSALAHVCLGRVLQADGDLDRAAAEYRTALSLGPAEIAHNNLAVIAMSGGRWSDAERDLRSELALQPDYARAYANLAIVLRHEGRLGESAAAQSRADALNAP